MRRGEVDFGPVTAGACPICGQPGCGREITGYERTAIDLFPEVRRGRVPIARFLCRATRRTFSLLPMELAPYHQYLVPTMLRVLVLFGVELCVAGTSLEAALEKALPQDHDVTVSLLRWWVCVLCAGFRRGHSELRKPFGLSDLRSGSGFRGMLEEVQAYRRGCRVRDPPALGADLLRVMGQYSAAAKRFLFGRSSQERR
jgi:hypothetical protein